MDKLRETYGPDMTNDLIILGLRREITRLSGLLTKVLSLEEEADTRANEGAEAQRQQAAKLRATEAQLKEAEYSLEQKELELADTAGKLSELAALRCMPSDSASSMTGEIAALRRQLENARAQNDNIDSMNRNLKKQLTVARFKMVRPAARAALSAAANGATLSTANGASDSASALKDELQATKEELDRVRKLALADAHRLKKQQERKDIKFEKLQRDYVLLRTNTGFSAGGSNKTPPESGLKIENSGGRLRFPTDWGAGAAAGAGAAGAFGGAAAKPPAPAAVVGEGEDDSDDSDLG